MKNSNIDKRCLKKHTLATVSLLLVGSGANAFDTRDLVRFGIDFGYGPEEKEIDTYAVSKDGLLPINNFS